MARSRSSRSIHAEPSPAVAGRFEAANSGEAPRAFAVSTAVKASCSREGEYWTIEFGGRLCRVREAKGLYCLAYLLLHPGERVDAAVLLMQSSDADGSTGVVDAAANGEAARVLVTKRIRGVVKKIAPLHASLAHHLDTCIKTGGLCVYLPDPESQLRWYVRL